MESPVPWKMGVDIPQYAVSSALKEHSRWQKQQQRRSTSEHHKYRLTKL